jgi:hypothetical protein
MEPRMPRRSFPQAESRSTLEKVVAELRRITGRLSPEQLGVWPPGPTPDPPGRDDDSGLTGSRVPRRPPDKSGSGAAALDPDDEAGR